MPDDAGNDTTLVRDDLTVGGSTGTASPTTTSPQTADERADAFKAQMLAYASDLRGSLARSREATEALARTHLETVASLAAAVDVRDETTGGHVYRVANYGAILAETMAPELRNDPQLIYGFLLHDIGKLAVPDAILNKAGALTTSEMEVMRTHVQHGIRFVKNVSFLRPALNLIATHHESWDGTGYPVGLRQEEIPLAARMFTVCDTLDAMLHDRPYRPALFPEEALAELQRVSGTQFDPDVIVGVEAAFERLLAVGDRPGLPGIDHGQAAARAATALTGNPIFAAVDQAMVLVAPDGRIVEANPGFIRMFGLSHPPVGMTLHEVLDRSPHIVTDERSVRDQFTKLQHDLFLGNREGDFTMLSPESQHIAWSSSLVQGIGDGVDGRLVVFREGTYAPSPLETVRESAGPAAAVASTPTTDSSKRDLLDITPDLEGLDRLLANPAPNDPAWVASASAARDRLHRVDGLLRSLTTDAVASAVDGEDWSPKA